MDFKQVERYKKKLLNNISDFPQIGRVGIRSGDIDKINEWIDIDHQNKIDAGISPAAQISQTSPFLEEAFYVIEFSDSIFGIKLKYEDDAFRFAIYPFEKDGSAPNIPKFGFQVTNIELGEAKGEINMPHSISKKMYEDDEIALNCVFNITTNSFYPKDIAMNKANSIFKLWGSINYFMINFKRDVKVSTYKYTLQNKGGSKGRKKKAKVITRTTYRCHLPDNWVARNEREYTEPVWIIPTHWHRNLVRADYLERKRVEMTEEEFNDKYKLSDDQSPVREGKIYVDIKYDETKGFRDEGLLSEDATGMKQKEYNI